MSRGGREGNNALCKQYGPINIDSSELADWVMSEQNISLAVVEKLIDIKVGNISFRFSLQFWSNETFCQCNNANQK